MLDRPEVHRLLNYHVVVRDAELLRVDWLMKDPRLRALPKGAYKTLGCPIPVVIDRGVLGGRTKWNDYFSNVRGVLPELS